MSLSTEDGNSEANPPPEYITYTSRAEANARDRPINSTDNENTVTDCERTELDDDTKVPAKDVTVPALVVTVPAKDVTVPALVVTGPGQDLTVPALVVTDKKNTISTVSALEMMEEGREDFAGGTAVLPNACNQDPTSVSALGTIEEGKEVVNGSLENRKIADTSVPPIVTTTVATRNQNTGSVSSLEMVEEGRETTDDDNDTVDGAVPETIVSGTPMTCNEMLWQYIRLVVHLILFPLMILISLAVPILIVVFCFALTLVTMLIYCCTPRGAEHSGVPFHVLVRQLLDAVDDDYDYHKPKYTRSEIEESLIQRKLLRIIESTDEQKDDNGDDEVEDPLNEQHHDYMFPASTVPGEQAIANTTNQSVRLSSTRTHFVTKSRLKPNGVDRIFIFSNPIKTNASAENKDEKPTQNAELVEDDDSGILSQENSQVCTNSGTDLLGSLQNTTKNEDARNQLYLSHADADDDAPGNLLGMSSSSHSNIIYPELEQLDTRWNGTYGGEAGGNIPGVSMVCCEYSPQRNLAVKKEDDSAFALTNEKRLSTSHSRDPAPSGAINNASLVTPIAIPDTCTIAPENGNNLVAREQAESSTDVLSTPPLDASKPSSLENHFEDIENKEKHDNNQQMESDEHHGPDIEVTIESSIDGTTERPMKIKIEEEGGDSALQEQQCVAPSDIFGNFNERGTATYCTICLLEYKEGDMVAWSSNSDACDHAFHVDCLLDWLQRKITCPNCRQEYVSSVSESSDVPPI